MTESNSFKLIIEDDEGRRSVVPVELGEASIGRLEGNTIRLKERNVSRHHARLVKEPAGMVFAEDLDSYNGLFVNGDRISGRSQIQEGDVLRIGDFQLELRGEGPMSQREEATQRTQAATAVRTDEITAIASEPTLTSTRPPMVKAPPAAPPPAAATAPPPARPMFQPIPSPVILPPATPDDADEEPSDVEPTAIIRSVPEEDVRKGAVVAIPAGHRAKLICVSTQYAGREFELSKAENVLGRTDENDIGIDHRSVSRHHAKITVTGRRFKIIDLESANGTLVNGEQYAQTDLKHGDLIELGHVKLRFVPAGESYALSAEEQAVLDAQQRGGVRSPSMWRKPIVVLALAAVVAALAAVWYVTYGSADKTAATAQTPAHTPAPAATGNGASEADQLLAQAQAALAQKNWKRSEAMANAVLALDPTREQARIILKQTDAETHAQHSLDTASAAMAQNAWSEAWNALQEIPNDSVYYNQGVTMVGQVRPALITERIADTKDAIKNNDFDEAQTLVDEVEGLDATRPEIAELRHEIDEGRKHHVSVSKNGKGTHRRDQLRPAKSAAPAGPADDPKALFIEGTKAVTAKQLPQAVDLFTRCISADKSYAQCYRALGIVNALMGNGPKAVHFYHLYLKVDPNAHDAPQVRQLLQQYESTQ